MPQATILVLFILTACFLFVIYKMLKLQKRYFATTAAVGCLAVALIFTISSVFWTTDTAYDRETIKHLELGWPVPFKMQNQSHLEPPLPYRMDYAWEGYGPVLTKSFYLSLLINYLGSISVWLVLIKLINKRG